VKLTKIDARAEFYFGESRVSPAECEENYSTRASAIICALFIFTTILHNTFHHSGCTLTGKVPQNQEQKARIQDDAHVMLNFRLSKDALFMDKTKLSTNLTGYIAFWWQNF
jgi:hypothetical protein